MKVTYYAFYLENKYDKSILFIDLKKEILKSDKWQNKKTNDSIFIKHVMGDVYFLVKTNDSDIIKKVDINNLEINDISKILGKNEKIGFASYFIVKDKTLGFASTLYAPKTRELTEIINLILTDNYSDFYFNLEPLTNKITTDDAVELSYIGVTNLRCQSNTGLFNNIISFLGGVTETNVDGIEIIIRPKRSKNIKNTVIPIIKNVSNELDIIKVKAKTELADQAIEIYIDDKNAIQGIIDNKEKDIPSKLEQNYQSLRSKIEEVLKYQLNE